MTNPRKYVKEPLCLSIVIRMNLILEDTMKTRGIFAPALAISLLFALQAGAQEEYAKKGPAQTGPSPSAAVPAEGWAGQLENFIQWVIKTRDLVPRAKDCDPVCYVLDSLELGGSVDQNALRFTLKGSVVSDKPVLVPLFGPPHQVMLSSVVLNGKPAVVGFEESSHYFVRTAEKSFTITGDLSLGSELSLTVPGPLNMFTSALADGRVVEGDRISGLSYATLHLEYGVKAEAEETAPDLPPVFQIARALRIQKEISFEYRVTIRSGSEVSSVKLPLPNGEVILDVPGHKGWKQEDSALTVPTSGRNVEFSVFGRIPKIGLFKPDERCSYEWWLIESDAEHRVHVKTEARQVDSTESPIGRQLESGRLYLVTKGQKLDVSVQSLASLEALAVVMSFQSRMIIWTKEGDLVAEDRIDYENNGIDYLAFDASGKPVYFEVDGEPHKILSDDDKKKSRMLIPLRKGDHSVRVQSLGKSDPSLFVGSLTVPVPRHDLTASRTSVTLGLPAGIIPLWFSGGEGIRSPIKIIDVVFVVIAFFMALIFFRGRNLRAAGFVGLVGFYFLVPYLFVVFVLLSVGVALVTLIWRRLRDWKRVLAFAGLAVALLVAGIVTLALMATLSYKEAPLSQEVYHVSDKLARYEVGSGADWSEGEMGQRSLEVQQKVVDQKFLGNVAYGGGAAVQGVTPVALPLPSYERAVSVSRELVTKDRPLEPTLIYVTRTALWPLLVIWILCILFALYRLWPRIRELGPRAAALWKKPPSESKA
jgi:hypothetical protein